jgi:hypothetical protein
MPHSKALRRRLDLVLRAHTVPEGSEFLKLWDLLVEVLEALEKHVYCVANALDEIDDNHSAFIEALKELELCKPS